MEIDRHTLEKMAALSRLHIQPEEEEALLHSMNDILNWMDQLREVDTEGVAPLTHMSFEQNVFREDAAHNSLARPDALKHSANHDDAFFKVPKVIE